MGVTQREFYWCSPGERDDKTSRELPPFPGGTVTLREPNDMSVVIQALNLKGGVGKTSTCFHLAGTLAKMGLRVLCVDLDPQGSFGSGFFGPQAIREFDEATTAAALYNPDFGAMPEQVIRPTGVANIDIVAANLTLATYNMTPVAEWGDSQFGVREFLDEVRGDYGVVLLDSPPNLQLCSWAGLLAADHLVIPLGSEDFAAQGIQPVLATLAQAQAGPNPGLRLAGLVLTMFDKRINVHQAYEIMLRESYGSAIFANPFPRNKDFIEAVAARVPVATYKPRCAGAKATQLVANELLVRVGLAEAEGQGSDVAEGRAA